MLIQNSEMEFGEKHSFVVDKLLKDGVYEMDLKHLHKFIKSTDTVIDVGANIGYYTLMMAQLANKVYALEADQLNFEILKQNVEINNYRNVHLFNKAVTASTSQVKLYKSDICIGMHRIYPSKYTTSNFIEVKSVALDDIIKEKIGFIKIDVEGSELGVLKGMPKLLEKTRIIMQEYGEEAVKEYGENPKEIFQILNSNGFKTWQTGKTLMSIKTKGVPKEFLIQKLKSKAKKLLHG